MLHEMEALVRANGGDGWVFTMVADGMAMTEVAKALGCSRPYVYSWINAGGEERKRGYQEARKLSAAAKEEQGEEILTDLHKNRPVGGLESSDVSLAVARSNYAKWQAEIRDRENYGGKGQIAVNVSIGSLHLDALRARGPRTAVAVPVEEPVLELAPAEVVIQDELESEEEDIHELLS